MNVFDLVAKLSLDTSEYEGKLSGISASVGKIGKFVASGVAAGTAAVTAFGGASVKTGMDFDSSMSQVAATMGKTVEEISDLRDFAQEMGSTTSFSATQSADALNYMALAGYDAETSMKMLPNVLNLAAAGGIELAQASDMVTDAQSALGLSLDETSELVDKMAMASSKSNTSVAQLGDAILTIGGTAKNVAGGTTELTAALGVLADNGIKGAEGGTALRNIVLSLSAPTDKAAKAMQALGLEAYDADGNLRPLNDIFNDLNGTLSTMTQGEQTQALNEIFNKVDLKSVNALLANSGERFDELSGYIDKAKDSAQNMADTQLDNLQGDITLMQSAYEGLQIAVSDKLTPSIRGFVQLAGEGLSAITQGMNDKGLKGAMDAISGLMPKALGMVIDYIPTIVEAGSQLIGALANGIMENLPQLFDAAQEIIVGLLDDLLTHAPEFIQTGAEMLLQLSQGISENLPIIIEKGLSVLQAISESFIENIDTVLEAGATIILAIADGLVTALPQMIPSIIEVIITIVEKLIENVDKLIDAAVAIVIALGEGIINALPTLIEKAPEIIDKLVTALIENAPKLIIAAVEMILQLVGGIVGAFPEIVSSAIELVGVFISSIIGMGADLVGIGLKIIGMIAEGIGSAISSAKEWGKDLIQNFIDGIVGMASKLWDTVKGIGQGIKNILGFSEPKEGPLSNFHTYAPDMIDLFIKGIRDNEGRLREQMESSFDFGNVGVAGYSSATVARPSYNDDASNISVNITLAGDADGIFRVVKQENTKYKKSNGVSAFA